VSLSDEVAVKVVTIVMLGLVLITAVIGITVVAVTTDRDLARAEALTFGGALLLAALGGVSWLALRRRHRWRVNLEHNGDNGVGPAPGGWCHFARRPSVTPRANQQDSRAVPHAATAAARRPAASCA
jgi:high-affinity Fe2+/Pb2+ permease